MKQRLVQCHYCGQINRISEEKLLEGMRPKCGGCKQPLPVDSTPIALTDRTFTDVVERSATPVLVDFWAPWCGPCQMLAPIIQQIASEFQGTVRVAKLNTDEYPAIAAKFQIGSIPTLIVFQNGSEIDRLIGAQPKSQIAARLRRIVQAA
jgi:thioredoxin 2